MTSLPSNSTQRAIASQIPDTITAWMTFSKELSSWLSPSPVDLHSVPSIGSEAPSAPQLAIPDLCRQPTVITFLRHCGCPFAEKTFLSLRQAAKTHSGVRFIAVSHSDAPSTEKWIDAVSGAGSVQVIVDSSREIYAHWGLGTSSFWHVLNPSGLWNVYQLGKKDNIWNRPTESGTRWQISGSFAVDQKGVVRWGQAAPSADWIPDFEEAIQAVEG